MSACLPALGPCATSAPAESASATATSGFAATSADYSEARRCAPRLIAGVEHAQPVEGGIGHGDELGIEDVGLVVGERVAPELEHRAAGGLEHGVGRGRVPFRRGSEPRIDV